MSKRTLLLAPLLLSFTSLSYADSAADAFTCTELGFLLSDYTYEETANGAFLMDLKSNMLGVNLAYAELNEDGLWKIEGTYQYGEMSYTSNGTGTMDGRKDYLAEIRALIGVPIALSNGIAALPYFGIGYHYVEDDSVGMQSSTGHWGYLREQSYYYSPIGIEIRGLKMDEDWSMGVKLEYDLFLRGLNRTDLTSTGGTSMEFEQDEGMGLRISLPMTLVSNGFTIEPFIKYWDIEDSSFQQVMDNKGKLQMMYEPANTTTELGLHFNILI